MLPCVSAHQIHLRLWHRTQKCNSIFRHCSDVIKKKKKLGSKICQTAGNPEGIDAVCILRWTEYVESDF